MPVGISELKTFRPDRIRLCWVPGRSEIFGNETADGLARLDRLSDDGAIVGPDPNILQPLRPRQWMGQEGRAEAFGE